MQEVYNSKGSSNKGENSMSSSIDLCSCPSMWENVMVAQLSKSKLGVISVSTKIFEAVETLT